MNYIPTLQTAREKWAPGKLFSSDEVRVLLDIIERDEREREEDRQAIRDAADWDWNYSYANGNKKMWRERHAAAIQRAQEAGG